MTALVLDTTFIIDAERTSADLDALIDDADDVAIAAITVAELGVGVELASEATRERRAEYVDSITSAVPVINYDATVAAVHAKLLAAVRKQGRPRGAYDLIIAATARATSRVVLTADASAFEQLPDVAVRAHR